MAQHQLRASPQTVRIGVFDASYPPLMTIESGDTVEVQCVSGRPEVMPPSSVGLKPPPALEAIVPNAGGGATPITPKNGASSSSVPQGSEHTRRSRSTGMWLITTSWKSSGSVPASGRIML